MDLSKEINQTVEGLIQNGKISEIIEKQLEATVKDIIESTLRSYSDFGRQIKEKLEKSLNCTDIDFPDYTTKMADYILSYVDGIVNDEIKKSMELSVREFFKPLDYESIKISEIVELLKNNIDEYDREDLTGECTAFIDNPHDSMPRLYFDKEEGKSKYDCDFSIALSQRDDGYEVYHINVKSYRDEHDLTKSKYAILGALEKTLFQLYSQKIKIIMDHEKINTELYFEEYY